MKATSEARISGMFRKPKRKIIIPPRVAARAAARCIVDDVTGCWISTYSVASHGYAQIGWSDPVLGKSQTVTIQRAAWVFWSGHQIPEGMTIDHMCKNRRCVNPEHLRALTNYENARRTSGRDWPEGECAHGHPNSELREIDGRIKCGKCALMWQADYRRKRRAAA